MGWKIVKWTVTSGYGWECPCGDYLWHRFFLVLVAHAWFHRKHRRADPSSVPVDSAT